MKTNIENKENGKKERVYMTVDTFINMWTEGLNRKEGFGGLLDSNVVVDKLGTEIRADDFEIDYDRAVVRLFYKRIEVGVIKLENIKLIY